MSGSIWSTRRVGDVVTIAEDDEEPALTDSATLIFASFYDSDHFEIPPGTLNREHTGPHPMTGQRVRVTRRFRSLDPRTREGVVAHLWSDVARFGVAECDDCFVGYDTDTWPTDWPTWDDVSIVVDQ